MSQNPEITDDRGIPDSIAEEGKGGRFDIDLAEKYAFELSKLNVLMRFPQELPKWRAQTVAISKAKTEEECVEKHQFLTATLEDVQRYISRPEAVPGVDSQERTAVFSRYAAVLNFIEVAGETNFDMLGLDEAGCVALFETEDFLRSYGLPVY